ncbi:MAG: family 43 glycosylhydrolase [Myxococcales bacterium]|nr:family 43 glycosylhydrolase [Myxococcales bacterium]
MHRTSPGIAALAIAAALAGCGGGSGGGGPRTVPIVLAPHTVLAIPTDVDVDGSPDIADPHVLKIGAVWYLYATQTKRNLEAWTSVDLATWEREGAVWEPTPGTWNEAGQAWAPHVEATEAGYYLYYVKDQKLGVAWSPSPLGPFEEIQDQPLVGGGHGGVGNGVEEWPAPLDFLNFDEHAIDAFVLKASDGSLTLYFVPSTPFGEIWAIPMIDYATLADVEPTVVLSPDLASWEGVVVEAPWVIEHEGRFHLLYSGNIAFAPEYAIGVAVGPTPLGPFERRADNPFLATDASAAFWGPGHLSIAPGPAGGRLMFYHTKVGPDFRADRRIRYAPVSFDAQGSLRLDVPAP